MASITQPRKGAGTTDMQHAWCVVIHTHRGMDLLCYCKAGTLDMLQCMACVAIQTFPNVTQKPH